MSVENDDQTHEELQELPPKVPESTEKTLLTKSSPESTASFVKQEYTLHNEDNPVADENEVDSTDGLQINDEDTTLSFEEEHSVIETKAGILETDFMPLEKQEVIEEESSSNDLFNEELMEMNNIEVETENVFLNENGQEEIRNEEDSHYENVFIQESHIPEEQITPVQYQEENTVHSNHSSHITNDSDTEDYNVVDGLHVTADTEVEPSENVYEQQLPFKHDSSLKQLKVQNTRLIKNIVRKQTYESNSHNKTGLFSNEKENVASDINHVYKYQKPNPRSILKSSFPLLEENNKDVNCELPNNTDKRILKSKTTTQARMLQNFIAKTTIIHAPVRQERLPRKQTIKPVQRQDEEIIVQEVVVSSNGFIETSEDGVLKSKEPLQPTVFLNVSDSDDDYDPKMKRNKKKKRCKKGKSKVITIVDSGDEDISEVSVIELSDSEEDNKATDKNVDSVVRKKRGRPLKTNKTTVETIEKREIKCSKCSKTFPSQGSLKTHMQYHNFKETSLKKVKTITENKFTCKHCNLVLKSSILLNKHLAEHKSLGCVICKKIFSTAMELSAHRRMHLKEKMCKSTIAERHSIRISKKVKSPPKLLKCDVCSRTFKDIESLDMHKVIHKKFVCLSCGCNFVSKMVLDMHVRENCVKIRSPTKGRLRMSTSRKVLENVKCDLCELKFTNYTNLFKHKVAEHGVQTPDKNVLKQGDTNTVLKKKKTIHGGVPSNKLLKNAYSSIKRKIIES